MELADTSDLGSDTSCVWVRVPLPPPYMSAYSNFIFLWNQLLTDLTKQRRSVKKNKYAGVDGMVDTADSKSVGRDTVWVRVPPPVPLRWRSY